MKKQLLLLMLLVTVFTVRVSAQCTPDPTLNGTGFTPAFLPPAYTDAAYNQVLSFMAPKDTAGEFNGSMVNISIDSVRLIDLRGMPANFSYECLERCAIPGGGKSCALLTGQADSTQLGGYKISIYLLTYFKVVGSPAQFSRIDSGNSYTFRIYRYTGLSKLFKGDAPVEIKAYPNPARNSIQLDLTSLPHHENGLIAIYDGLGREVYSGSFTNNASGEINVSGFTNGLYRCMVKSSRGTYYTSFLKE